MARALSVPQVVVNGIVAPIVPNSLKFVEGFGERKIRTASLGGASVETYATTDLTTKYGKISFDMITTDEAIALKKTWQINYQNNSVEWLEAGQTRRMANAAIMEDPEVTSGMDGQFTVTFQGDPLVG